MDFVRALRFAAFARRFGGAVCWRARAPPPPRSPWRARAAERNRCFCWRGAICAPIWRIFCAAADAKSICGIRAAVLSKSIFRTRKRSSTRTQPKNWNPSRRALGGKIAKRRMFHMKQSDAKGRKTAPVCAVLKSPR